MLVSKTNSWSELCVFVKNAVNESYRVLEELGSSPPESNRVYKYGNVMRGIYCYAADPRLRTVIKDSISNAALYRTTNSEHLFSRNGGTAQTKRVGELIANGPLKGARLRILDAACNHGYLAKNIVQPIDRYIGMDLFEETISVATLTAREIFSKIDCSDYQFIVGNILKNGSYRNLPKDNNVAVCTGVAGHFRPSEITKLLENLNQILANEDSSRIYFGYPVLCNQYTRRKELYVDEGINYYSCIGLGGIKFRCYDPDQLEKFVEQCGFEIDWMNSDVRRPSIDGDIKEKTRSLHLCLKKKISSKGIVKKL